MVCICQCHKTGFKFAKIEETSYIFGHESYNAVPCCDCPWWIKCSEKMPGFDIEVLTTDGKDIRIAVYQDMSDVDTENRWHSSLFEVKVTHWMPLPKQPKE